MIPSIPLPPPARIQKAMVNQMEHQLKSLTQILLAILWTVHAMYSPAIRL